MITANYTPGIEIPSGSFLVTISPESIDSFKKLLTRGINTWADEAPPEIRNLYEKLMETTPRNLY